MLRIVDLHVHYGKAHALKGMSVSVVEGEITALLGPNGAGKTTLLNTISGLVKPSAGQILFCGEPIQGCEPAALVRRGIVQVAQGRQLFPSMTVLENLEMGAFLHDKPDALDSVYTLFPRLKERAAQRAGTLSGGEAQMLAIGRGLMAKPKILLLDEPSLGLSPLLVRELQTVIRNICDTGVPILLVEQNARMALDVADRAYVMRVGEVLLDGTAAEIGAGDYVQRAYLGLRSTGREQRHGDI